MKPRIALALLAVVSAVVARPAEASRWTERSDRDVDARDLKVLEVDNPRGDVLVTASADGRLHVTAIKIARGRDQAEARGHAREIQVTAGAEGDRYTIRVEYPQRVDVRVNFWDLLFSGHDDRDVGPTHQLDLQLQVPEALEVRVVTTSGDVTTRGLSGRQSLGTTSGDCAVTGATGAVEIRTVSGDARLRGSRRATVRTTSGDIEAAPGGPLEAHSSSGDVEVEDAPDSLVVGTVSGDVSVHGAARRLEVETSSGTIEARDARGDVRARSTSGGIELALVAPLRSADVSSSSGDVSIALAPGADARLDLSTSSGDIDCDVPVTLLEHGRRNLIAKFGRGGATVKAQTVSGDLHVTSGGR